MKKFFAFFAVAGILSLGMVPLGKEVCPEF